MNRRFEFSGPAGRGSELEEMPAAESGGGVGVAEGHLFDEVQELPPTWSRGGRIYHTTEKCSRLRAIRRGNRESGVPGLREHCLNCKDIMATKRRG